MKKLLIVLFLFICMPVIAQESCDCDRDMDIVEKLGVLDTNTSKISKIIPQKEIKKIFKLQERYTNRQDIEGIKSIYADKYVSCDGFDKKIFADLAEKTWKTYKNLKYKCYVRNIILTGDNTASVEVEEYIEGLSYGGTKYITNGYGLLENVSKSVYFLEKINEKWQIVSDNIYFEHTFLTYGSAKFIPSYLSSPEQVSAGSNYEISLSVVPPKNSVVIGSLAKENITYPQISAGEVFRKLPETNVLERIIKANTKNLNEYAVAFYVVMDTNGSENIETLQMKFTGVGIAMNRVNVIPKNKYIKVENEKVSQEHK